MKREPRKSYAKNTIVDYWVDSDKFNLCLTDVCWVCGAYSRRLEKCHIEPLWRGGLDEVSNIVLLCRNCHCNTEGLSEDAFWFYVSAYPFDMFGQVISRGYALGLMNKKEYKELKQWGKTLPTP